MIIPNKRKTITHQDDFPVTKGDALKIEHPEIFGKRLIYFNFWTKSAPFLFFALLIGLSSLKAQNKNSELQNLKKATATDTIFKGFIFPSHDSILHINLKTIEMIAPYQCNNKREVKKYNQLEADVLKTYPLALIVSSEIHIVDAEFENSNADQSKEKRILNGMRNTFTKLISIRSKRLMYNRAGCYSS